MGLGDRIPLMQPILRDPNRWDLRVLRQLHPVKIGRVEEREVPFTLLHLQLIGGVSHFDRDLFFGGWSGAGVGIRSHFGHRPRGLEVGGQCSLATKSGGGFCQKFVGGLFITDQSHDQ